MPTSTQGRSAANYHTQALSRGLRLLQLIGAHPGPMTLAELHESSQLPKSTLVRLLSALVQEDFLVRVDEQPSYRLGHMVMALSQAYLGGLDVSALAHDELADLARRSRQTANLAVLDGTEVLHVAVERPDRALRFDATVGSHGPAWCTALGKMLLSDLPADRVEHHVPDEPWSTPTGRTAADLAALRRDLTRIRRRGYAFDDNEFAEGLSCLAVLVSDERGTIGALSLSGASGEFAGPAQKRLLQQLTESAQQLGSDPAMVDALRAVARN